MTPQEFQSILPCYFGQKMVVETLNARVVKFICYYPQSNYPDWGKIYYYNQDGSIGCHSTVIPSLKLILRKMEDMTDEEKSICKMLAADPKAKDEFERAIIIYHYLRSIGIDCDGLIESGYAIHQKEVKL